MVKGYHQNHHYSKQKISSKASGDTLARINIEDSIYKDDRFINLILNVGDKCRALGVLVSVWSLAQKYYLDETNERLIPLNARTTELNEMIRVGLAEEKHGGFYVKGSKDQFSWLLQKSNAGKKSAEIRKKSKNKAKKTNGRATAVNGSQPPTPTPTPTPTQSLAHSQFSSQNANLTKEIWGAYELTYESRYGVKPTRNASVNGKIAQIAKRLGAEATEVVKFYVLHNDAFYIRKAHAIGLCLSDAESLHTQWKTGKQITGSKVRQFEKRNETQELIDDIMENGI